MFIKAIYKDKEVNISSILRKNKRSFHEKSMLIIFFLFYLNS